MKKQFTQKRLFPFIGVQSEGMKINMYAVTSATYVTELVSS